MDTCSQINPLGIDLVLDLLLDHLEPKYLRKCRLVCHQWNSRVVSKMRGKSDPDYMLPVDTSNILEYSSRIKHSALPPESLMPVSLNVLGGRDGEGIALDKFIVTELADHLGPQFIQHLSCTSAKTLEDWGNVFELVHLLSPGLKSLWISEGPFKQSITQFRLASNDLCLAALNSITYFEILKNPTLLVDLVNSTVNLKELVIVINSMESIKGELYRNRSTVISKALNQIEPSRFQNVTRLVVPLDDEKTYRSLYQFNFPELRQLKLSLKRNSCDESARILSLFLTSKCPKLTSLEFSFLICKRELGYPLLGFPNGNEFSEFPKYLPQLPKLTHFGYEYDEFPAATSTPAFIRVDHLNAACFPNVQSVTVPYGTFLFSSSGFDDPDLELESVDWYNNPALIGNLSFSSVTKLTLVLNTSLRFGINFKMPKLTAEEACNQMHLLFPNVDEVMVDLHWVPLNSESCYDRANEFLANLLQELSPLRTLQLANYFHSQRRFLGFLKENPIAVEGLQSVQELRFVHYSRHAASVTGKRTKTCLPISPVQKKGTIIADDGFLEPVSEPPTEKDVSRKSVLEMFSYILHCLPGLKVLKMDGVCLTNNCSERQEPEAILKKLQGIFSKLNFELS